ncbi:MFS transporter [Brevibacillus sp. HB1.3]|uniref:MFS transporter n=1 Tax=Brevibacillus sp. HB1.3 TaxID=2738842 RepID=UPI0015548483|nr:MFS transporter [Brevibacillus sp. HB1.3]NQF14416.1 MFS transporter [Brevibacillus sp. HB1.3]
MNPRVFILAIATFVVGTVELIIGGTLDLIARDLQVSISAAGQLITIFSLAFAIAAPLLLHVTRRVERKKLYLYALAAFFLSNVLAALSPSYAVLMTARVLSAASSSILIVLSITIATNLVEPAYRGRAIGVIFMGISGSLVLGVPVGLALGNVFGWRAPFWLIAALSIVAMLFILLFLPKVQTAPPIPLRDQMTTLRSGKLFSALFIVLLMLTGHLTLYAYFTPYLQTTMNVDGTTLSWIYLLFGLAAVAGGGIGGWIADKWGATKSILFIIPVFGLIMCVLPFFTGSLYLFLPIMFIWSALSWAISPAQQNYLISCSPATADIQLSLNTSAQHLGIALGSLAGGLVVERSSVIYTPWVGAVFVLISFGFAFYSISRPFQAQESQVVQPASGHHA